MRSTICGSSAAHSDCMFAATPSFAESGHVLGVHDLDVRDVVPVAVAAVRGDRVLDRVEALAHGAVADRVEVQLEAEPVELGGRGVQHRGVDERDPGVVGEVTVPVAVRLEHRRREVLGDAVLHDLDARRRGTGRRDSARAARRATGSARGRPCDPTRAPRRRGR